MYRLRPTHLVHPEHGKPGVRDTYGHALCPECRTLWRFNRDNSVETNQPFKANPMTTFEYKDFRVTLTNIVFASGDQEWGFSIRSGDETVRHREPRDRLPSDGTAAAAARKWIDEHRT